MQPINPRINENDENVSVYSRDPKIYTIKNYLSDEECDHIINLSQGKLKQALVSGQDKGYVSAGRTGSNYWLPHNADEKTLDIAQRISTLVDIPLENAEAFQVIYYGVSQEYRQHYDGWLRDGSERSRRNMKYGGQRMITALCYLNTVEEGGGTNFPRVKQHVNSEKGKIVVFHNVYDGTNNRHAMSEHAGMPVKKGEKWAFNLWFREDTRKRLYDYKIDPNEKGIIMNSSVNHEQQPPKPPKPLQEVSQEPLTMKISTIDMNNEIYSVENLVNDNDMEQLSTSVTFNDSDKSTSWVKHDKVPNIVDKVSKILGIESSFFESVFAVKYKHNYNHNCHYDAYDLTTENGKKYTQKLGQRLITVTGFLTDDIVYEFNKLGKSFRMSKNTLLVYKNTNGSTNIRNDNVMKRIMSNGTSHNILYHVYIREYNSEGNKLVLSNSDIFSSKSKMIEINGSTRVSKPDTIQMPPTPPPTPDTTSTRRTPQDCLNRTKIEAMDKVKVDYIDTLRSAYDIISKDTRDIRNGFKDLSYHSRVPWRDITPTINQLYNISNGNNETVLNHDNLNVKYNFGELTPVTVENVFTKDAHELYKKYFTDNIKNGLFALGDKQANRYKAHNETMCRYMHYEVLPLIETIVGRKLRPTYTYLSCYKKGTDLPAHTDRPDCEYTVSYIVDKPKDFTWNIYFHPEKQPVKNQGRYNFTPNKDECIPVDCNENGLMIFQGEDHLHFREKLEADYYNIVLLHFRACRYD